MEVLKEGRPQSAAPTQIMKRIHDSLKSVFLHNRLVFWYDANNEWSETFESFEDQGVVKLKVEGNEFGTKVRVVRDPNPQTKFLIYIPTSRPDDPENWLLDLLLQGYEYKADRASLAIQEVGLPNEFLFLAEEHSAFFRSSKRNQELKELVHKDDQARDIRLKMMTILGGLTTVEIDALLLLFLSKPADEIPFDPVEQLFAGAALVNPFRREVEKLFGYTSATPSLRDFTVSLFRGANPLDTQVKLHPHAKVFLQRWKDSQAHRESFRSWSTEMESKLQIRTALEAANERTTLGDSDAFEIFEKFTLHRLCKSFERGAAASEIRAVIQQRRGSFWYSLHADGYLAVEQAVELRELLASAELSIDTVQSGVSRYVATWWRIDMAYRRFIVYLRRYGQVQLMEQISGWVNKAYLNNFLLPLTDRWSDQVRRLEKWRCEGVTPQRRFFETYVQPFLSKNQKVFVIVSDALRYEAAAEFAQRLQSANRWTAEIEPLLGSLPTYTQLGMASLLPGKQWSVDANTSYASVDGRSASGTPNRAEILRQASAGKAVAIQAEDFLELNTKTEGRALTRDHDVVYVFHNHIDKVGDTNSTEARTFDAVEETFDELEKIIKKVANINGNNMLITADHGFLFQQDAVADDDMTPMPDAREWTFRTRRFALGKGVSSTSAAKVFSSEALGLRGDWSAAFPLSLGRYPCPGSGKRFVHGGVSLQEVIVPVIKIHKARSDDTAQVEVELLRVPAKITTGQISISLFQDRPALDKVLPRTLRAGVFATDDTELSEIKTLTFDSKDTEARHRESTVVLVLSHSADAFNNSEVELRFIETVQGTTQDIVYKTHRLKLQKPFASDFDEH